jgi:thiol-disulfide isomerase/thioredoxin
MPYIMKSPLPLVLSLAAIFALTPFARAAELGNPAEPLQISTWIKGKPVDLAAGKGKQVFVIEFWATWCPPCRASIPHLTELQKKFKDVPFVGISDEDQTTVKKFVEKMGDKMDYTVAVDKDRKTSAAYMGAFGIDGIPHAFIVDKQGRVVWHGHPMTDLERSLEEIVAGKFDLAKAKKREAAQKQLEEFYQAASEGKDEPKIDKLGKELEALDAEIGGIEPGRKFNAAEVRKMVQFQSALRDYQMNIAMGTGGTNQAQLEKRIEALAPKDFNFADFKETVTLNKTFSDYFRAAAGQGDQTALPELAKKLAEAKTQNARLLNEWAWAILTDQRLKTHDVDLATKLAKAAVDISGGKDVSALDTYARAQFDSGKVNDAIETQQKAVAAAVDGQMRKELEATLKKYQEKLAAK